MRNSSINWIFLRRFTIHSHSKLSITNKRRNKAEYPTWNSIRLGLVEKTSMPHPIESFEHIHTTARVAPDLLRALEFYQIQLSDNLKLIEKTWNHTGNEKSHISRGDQQAYYLHRFRRSYHGKKTNMAVVFSRGPLTKVLKYRGHRWCHPTIWKISFLRTHNEEFNKYAEKFRLTVLRSTIEIQSKPDAFDEPRLVMRFLTKLEVTGRLCNFRLVVGAK